jgi:hypothetical protein
LLVIAAIPKIIKVVAGILEAIGVGLLVLLILVIHFLIVL